MLKNSGKPHLRERWEESIILVHWSKLIFSLSKISLTFSFHSFMKTFFISLGRVGSSSYGRYLWSAASIYSCISTLTIPWLSSKHPKVLGTLWPSLVLNELIVLSKSETICRWSRPSFRMILRVWRSFYGWGIIIFSV